MAASLVHVLRFASRHVRLNSSFPVAVEGRRYLLSPDVLRYDNYLKQSSIIADQMEGRIDVFHGAIADKLQRELPLAENDVKHMLHTCRTQEDFKLAEKALKSYHEQTQHIRRRHFRYGPVLMRCCQHLGLEEKALELVTDQSLQDIFLDVTTYCLLMHMLFTRSDYKGVLRVFELMHSRSIRANANAYKLAFAALYKQNTPEAFARCKGLYEGVQQGDLTDETTGFIMALALNQNDYEYMVNVYNRVKPRDCRSCQSLNVLALARLEQFEDMFAALRIIFERDVPTFIPKWEVSQQTMTTIRQTLEEKRPELVQQLEDVYDSLKAGGHLVPTSVEVMLMEPPPPTTTRRASPGLRKSFQRTRRPNTRAQADLNV
ncbi:pentatricopeptide repeat-containing protein 2, mitochondrial-like isoform X1 [Branchiostoma floridae]|uniref:Pentatricopeptide repeat-containing protein 2, mitochondrial n=1 Tax=Branchiostoma floridae TaxID=7739 RepID=A0A9J7KKP0_BRAFL|nr:pentatricopeptide repeat-containing protein 2, mitochondrial-like isoform X1 [Branchiostoma floridae]